MKYLVEFCQQIKLNAVVVEVVFFIRKLQNKISVMFAELPQHFLLITFMLPSGFLQRRTSGLQFRKQILFRPCTYMEQCASH